MIHQLFNKFAVTIAFGAGATGLALVLDIHAVQGFLGMHALPPEELPRLGLAFAGIASSAGLIIDGLRLLARAFWPSSPQPQRDLANLFRNSLA